MQYTVHCHGTEDFIHVSPYYFSLRITSHGNFNLNGLREVLWSAVKILLKCRIFGMALCSGFCDKILEHYLSFIRTWEKFCQVWQRITELWKGLKGFYLTSEIMHFYITNTLLNSLLWDQITLPSISMRVFSKYFFLTTYNSVVC